VKLWRASRRTFGRIRWSKAAGPLLGWLITSIVGVMIFASLAKFLLFPTLGPETARESWVTYFGRWIPYAFGAAPGLAFLHLIWKALPKVPLDFDVEKYLGGPRYESKVSFLEQFQTDFADYVKANIDGRKVFVFIDDLDRCEVPKAAELLQAINMILASRLPMYVLVAMDRLKIAAGVAARHRDLLRFLPPSAVTERRSEVETSRVRRRRKQHQGSLDDERRTGLAYGYEFVEKFVQLQLRVPRLSRKYGLSRFLSYLLDPDPPADTVALLQGSAPALDSADDDVVKSDGPLVEKVMRMVAPALDFNPRRLKQFLNLFRLRHEIALQTEAFHLGSTLPQVGKIVAIELCWPRLLDRLIRHPGQLKTLVDYPHQEAQRPLDGLEEWLEDPVLRTLLKYSSDDGNGYQLDIISSNHLISALYGAHETEIDEPEPNAEPIVYAVE